MSWMYVFIPIVWGAVVSSYTVELTVRPGENVALQCDCKLSTGETLKWFRNCSHENQPPRVVSWDVHNIDNSYKDLNMMWNDSSKSYILVIRNITDSHLGLYYCGTEKWVVIDGNKIVPKYIRRYGNVTTRISFGKPIDAGAGDPAAADCGRCWTLLVTLCPSSALLSLFLYFLCSHMVRAGKHPGVSQEARPLTLQHEDENYSRVFYAVLETPQHKGSHSFSARSASGL
ncbi:uncharacterized protein LOC130383245 [Gadus chalcogrammus]|uniref:uncharacterized protein LOC130383245 n=1 Tax=Gadus chalcogrammus TaxID=1042646 RepID=UPI0024C2F1E7|nr:uncharacterized protein LOC130383245 [Gadus chalcogrammus]